MIVGFSGGGTDIAVASRAKGWSVTFPLNRTSSADVAGTVPSTQPPSRQAPIRARTASKSRSSR